jgi:hypothetical protein
MHRYGLTPRVAGKGKDTTYCNGKIGGAHMARDTVAYTLKF